MTGIVRNIGQGALNLMRRAAPSERAFEEVMIRGPRGEYYTFPKEATRDQRKGWRQLRDMIYEGVEDPAYQASQNLGKVPASKLAQAQSAARLAGMVKEQGLPRTQSFMSPAFDALALKTDDAGRKANAVAALDGPQTIKEPGAMYLYDLAANVDAPGSGNELLKSILSGPLFPDADKVVFTPLPKARKFYEDKFGAEYMPPLDALSDDVVSRILKSVGMQHNAEDLGVGILRRAEGGLVKPEMDHGIQQKEFEKSKKAMWGGLGSLGKFLYDMVVPQDAVDVGLMMVGGPGGKAVKKLGAAVAASGAGDAEASPLAKALRYAKQAVYKDVPLDNGEFTTMFVNPTESEMAKLMNISRRVAHVEGGQPAVRLLRDLRNPNIYAADGNKVLHSDMAGHVPGLTKDSMKTDIWFPDEPQERALNFLKSLPAEKAHGGLVALKGKHHG